MFHPKNYFMNRGTVALDTIYLRIIIITATLLTCLGANSIFLKMPTNLNFIMQPKWIIVFTSIPVAIIPVIFWLASNYINKKIAAKLQAYGPTSQTMNCPFGGNHLALQTHEVVDKDTGKITFKCYLCDKIWEHEVALNLGQ
jgi:hypothetical protein